HATGAGSDPRGTHRCGSDEELRVVRGTRAAQVMLGEPDPVEPEALGMLNAFQRLGERILLGSAGRNRPEFDDRQLQWVTLLGLRRSADSTVPENLRLPIENSHD